MRDRVIYELGAYGRNMSLEDIGFMRGRELWLMILHYAVIRLVYNQMGMLAKHHHVDYMRDNYVGEIGRNVNEG